MRIRICLAALEKCCHRTCTVRCDTSETVEDIIKYRSLFQAAVPLTQTLYMMHLEFITEICNNRSQRSHSLCSFLVIFHKGIAGYIDFLTDSFHDNI